MNPYEVLLHILQVSERLARDPSTSATTRNRTLRAIEACRTMLQDEIPNQQSMIEAAHSLFCECYHMLELVPRLRTGHPEADAVMEEAKQLVLQRTGVFHHPNGIVYGHDL